MSISRVKSGITAAGLMAVMVAFALSLAGWAGSAEASPTPVWQAQTTPSPKGGALWAISCVKKGDCVGVGGVVSKSSQRSLAETEKSGKWKIDTLPQPAGDSNLDSVSCHSLTNCVAVGATFRGGAYHIVTEVLSGTTWKIVKPATLAGVDDSYLYSVTCPEANSCVAVGFYDGPGTALGTLAESYNGHTWSLIKTHGFSGEAEFMGISCVANTVPRLCTAVGEVTTTGGKSRPLVEHVDGSAWSVVTVPNLAGGIDLQSVSCPQPTSCVAVGAAAKGNSFEAVSEIDTQNHWKVVKAKAPPVPHGTVDLASVSCPLSIQSCRAVGGYGNASQSTLAESWNGHAWSIQTSANPTTLSQLDGVSCVTTGTSGVACAAAGEHQPSPQGASHTLIEHN